MFLTLPLSSEVILNGSVLEDLELFPQLSHLVWNFLALLILIPQLSHQFTLGRGAVTLLGETPPSLCPHLCHRQGSERWVPTSPCVQHAKNLSAHFLGLPCVWCDLKCRGDRFPEDFPLQTHSHMVPTQEPEFSGLVTKQPALLRAETRVWGGSAAWKWFLWGNHQDSEGNFQFRLWLSGCRELGRQGAALVMGDGEGWGWKHL